MAGQQDQNKAAKKLQKSYFDVLGLCCSSEVPLVENILKPLLGVKEVSVVVATRTVIVVHDSLLISQLQIVIGTIALNDYLEAGTIVFLFTIAEWLESRAGHKAKAVMSSLMSMAPQKAVLADTGEVVDVDEVKLNTLLAVKAGEVIPIDGIVVDGKGEVDEKTLTGESYPVTKEKDSTVWAGTVNLNGYISVKTTALAEDCVVAEMSKLVEEAQNSKTRTERFIDKCAKFYTPAVLVISISIAAIPAALRVHNWSKWFHLALVVLVSACPCALILSTPVVTFCTLTKAATSGLLIKGGDFIEILAKVKIVAFDKTGTITRGEFVVMDFQSLRDDISLNTLIYWVSSIERKASHPMAAALVDYGRSFSIEPNPENVENFENFPGEGIHGKIDGQDIYIGSKRIALRASCETIPTIEGSKGGKTIGYIYCERTPAGVFTLSDACRTGAADAVRELKKLGIKTAMLTGDSHAAATQANEQLEQALDVVHAELLPEDKAKIIKEFKMEGNTAMVGDGINDAPALATADIGISMGISGSALAQDTGNIILMSNDVRKLPKAIQLARRAKRKVIENVILSISTKVGILALAFAGHPLVWAAVLADVGTCLLVILNSMLLLQGTHRHGEKHVHNHGKHEHSHSHRNQKCFSDQKVAEACKSQRCASQRCESECRPSSNSSLPGNHKCSSDLHEAKHHDHGSCRSHNHGSNRQSHTHTNQNCCSESKTVVACEPPKCSSQSCGSDCQPSPLKASLADNCKCEDSEEIHSCPRNDELHEAKNCDNHDLESQINHKHGCLQTENFSSCEDHGCTDLTVRHGHGSCGESHGIHEKKDCNHHSAASLEENWRSKSIDHCHSSHCDKEHISNEASEQIARTSCEEHHHHHHQQHQHQHHHHQDQKSPPHMIIDIVQSSNHTESASPHPCISLGTRGNEVCCSQPMACTLEKREFGGCCKSYMKECCSGHGPIESSYQGSLAK
ncbi:cadmium/zinc-transporting ATPase HMA3-like isoform X2 [Rosa rugosa]|uniref:cadmium/zinc-transporting ATPase HMA3-like isoform X2 n=1 Tax=Rosa rugosa TaxID=74645 RepID=UPI002B404974|nr:cadmium/zinc-transporting ATPase HMA3-like isoform X2 [Rosa rugosa]